MLQLRLPLLLCLAAMLPQAALGYEGAPVTNGGSIQGRILFKGEVPPPKTLTITQDAKVIGGKTHVLSRELLVAPDGGVKNAIVFIDGIGQGKPLPKTQARILDNRNLRYEPHVMAVTKGTPVHVKNSDDVLHNTHAKVGKKKRTVFNVGLPIQGQISKQKVRKPGLHVVNCDAGHTWMRAYIYVFRHPYFAVTDAKGAFRLEDVPPGQYTVKVWHETLKEKTGTVTVAAGGVASLDLELSR